MKKITTALTLLILLSSCGSSSDDTNVKLHTGDSFTMNIPSSWTNVEKTQLPSPKNGKIELALTSSEINTGFANNLVVLSEDIVNKTTSSKYSIANYVRTTGSVNSYTKIAETNFTFSDKDESILYTFEAKYNNSTPARKFIQTAKICGNKAFLMTVGINIDNSATAKYENLLKSFACKTK